MGFTLLDWHWLVIGMVLVIAEIFLPSFTIFWFGLGALSVAAALWLVPGLSLSWQLFLWAATSCVFTLLWFRYVRPRMGDRTKAGISREAVLGETGRVIRAPGPETRGLVRFTTPLLGNDEWPFIALEEVAPGDRVHVRDISGNTLIVAKTEKG
jgi:membrane protein implicated in regulation of membrane protease activity